MRHRRRAWRAQAASLARARAPVGGGLRAGPLGKGIRCGRSPRDGGVSAQDRGRSCLMYPTAGEYEEPQATSGVASVRARRVILGVGRTRAGRSISVRFLADRSRVVGGVGSATETPASLHHMPMWASFVRIRARRPRITTTWAECPSWGDIPNLLALRISGRPCARGGFHTHRRRKFRTTQHLSRYALRLQGLGITEQLRGRARLRPCHRGKELPSESTLGDQCAPSIFLSRLPHSL